MDLAEHPPCSYIMSLGRAISPPNLERPIGPPGWFSIAPMSRRVESCAVWNRYISPTASAGMRLWATSRPTARLRAVSEPMNHAM